MRTWLFLSLPVVLGFSQSELIHSLSLLLAAYCTYFGHTFTHKVVRLTDPNRVYHRTGLIA